MKSEKDVRKAHIILLICQVITFTLALTLGICVIVIKQIKSGYSLAFFAGISLIALLCILNNVGNYKKTMRKK